MSADCCSVVSVGTVKEEQAEGVEHAREGGGGTDVENGEGECYEDENVEPRMWFGQRGRGRRWAKDAYMALTGLLRNGGAAWSEGACSLEKIVA